MNKSDIFWQTYLNLENSLVDLGKYVLISDVSNSDGWRSQLDVFSPYIADLLVSCCVQIEAISKELYFNLGGTKKRGSTDLYFDEDCLRLIDKTWNAGKKVVNVVSPIFYLTKEDSKVLRPLKNSGKRQGTYWGRAYQAVKHDRYESMPNGNIKALLGAMAALYLLNIYYRNDFWLTKNSDINSQNWSMGSTVFSVLPPITQELWYGNKPIFSESPFVASYTNESYSKIKKIQDEEARALESYLSQQPELSDPEFIKWMEDALFRDKSLKTGVELYVYRLNKSIPTTLSFQERKQRLIDSQEWKHYSANTSDQTNVDNITEVNIQTKIDSCGRYFGYCSMYSIQKLGWVKIATGMTNLRVYIPEKEPMVSE